MAKYFLQIPWEEYLLKIFDRFRNENIGDKLERIAMDGVGKFPIFILPTIKNCFQKNIIPANAIDSIAQDINLVPEDWL